MPPAERHALLWLLALALAGQAVRYLLTRPGEPPGQVQLLASMSPPGSAAAQRDSAMAQGRPLRPGETIDVDRASMAELTRLPKVGPRLAKTILAHRIQHGPFGSLAGLDQVAGVGPGLLRTLEPHVAFGGAAGQRGSGAGGSAGSGLHSSETPRGDSAAHPPATGYPPRGPSAPLNLNTATLQQLDSLPGVGPAKAAAILRYRQEQGPFTAVDQLAGVPGLGPAAVSRLRNHLAAP
jgi:competence ComEA-like helix-hairpin-helix protein